MRTVPLSGYRAVGDGASILCFHCSGSSSGQWTALAEHVGEHYRVAAVDLVGYGSSRPWEPDESPSLAAEVARLAALGNALDAPVHLVGHSYGGAVALRYALSHPESVASLVLYEPVPFALLRHEPSGRLPLEEIGRVAGAIHAGLACGQVDPAARVFFDYWSGQGTWDRLSPEMQQRLMPRMGAIGLNFDALMADDTRPGDLQRLDMPVLYLGGAAARAPVAAIRAILEARCPNIDSRTLPGLGHMGPVTHADRLNEQIAEFIALHNRRWTALSSANDVDLDEALPALA